MVAPISSIISLVILYNDVTGSVKTLHFWTKTEINFLHKIIVTFKNYRIEQNFGGKIFGEIVILKHWRKKLW